MKKRTKLIILIASATALLCLVTALILFAVFKDSYLEELPYDNVGETAYENVAIVAEDGLWYLEQQGVRSEKGYSFLKSVNDFYTSEDTADLATRHLYPYYLARTADYGNYLLVDPAGAEYRITGDNFSLSEVCLPYLIFTNNTNSRMAAISLQSLASDLSARSDNEIAFSITFPTLEPRKFEEDSETYDYLFTKSNSEDKGHTVYSAAGAKLVVGSEITTRILENEAGEPVYYFVDEATYALYTAKGERLSLGGDAPVLAENGQWGYQLCHANSAPGTTEERFLLVFSADHSMTFSDTEYNLDDLHVREGCLWFGRLHDDNVTVASPLNKSAVAYHSLSEENGMLSVTLPNTADRIYLDDFGRELCRSPYTDMQRHELSDGDCTVLTSARCNAESAKTVSFFFTAPNRQAVRLDLPTHSSLSPAPRLWSEEEELMPLYLISETDTDGTPLTRLYAPFAVNPQSDAYHTLDFYSHGGILWALGTSYTREKYDLIDPVNNRISLSIDAKSGNLARLTFEYCDTDALLADATDEESGVPVIILKLARYDENQLRAVAARYFALYRTAPFESDTFQNTTLQARELGQNLLLSHPYRFFGEKNCLAVYSLTGTRVFRLDEAYSLDEYATLPYHVTDVLSDVSDPLRYFLKFIPFTDGSDLLMESDCFGLADLKGNLLLSPYYEDITFADGDYFGVTLKKAEGVVTLKKGEVKTVIDFRYASVTPLGDGGFAALRRDGVCELYRGDDKIGKGELQSIGTVRHTKTDADGYPIYSDWILLNLDGTLYRHELQGAYPPLCHRVSAPTSLSNALTDRRAKLVSYYDENGKLSKTDLLLPTVSDGKDFGEAHALATWYAYATAQKQTAPVSAEEILASEEYFFHLYPPATVEEAKVK